jgi:DNA-binding transcriptional MerR regulator
MDSSQLIPIGAFSSVTQLSTKALRLYAENGILPPAWVDEQTAYRYYTHEQVRTARLIRTLRDMDMPLALGAQCVQRPDRVEALAQAHMRELANAHAQQQIAHRNLNSLIHSTPMAAHGAVSTLDMAAGVVVLHSFLASAMRFHTAVAQAFKELGQQAAPALLDTNRSHVLLPQPLTGGDEMMLELCVPVASKNLPEQTPLATRHQPAQRCACVPVSSAASGPDFVAATDALFDWFDRHGKTLHGTPVILINGGALQLAWPVA